MRRWRRVLFFLLINVLVSACTTFMVLQVWNRYYGGAGGGLDPVALLIPTATPTPEPMDLGTPQVTPTIPLEIYQVQTGDTLGSIAEAYGVPVEQIMQINGLNDPNALGSGEVLLIPVTPDPASLPPTETPILPEPTATPLPFGDALRIDITTIVGAGSLPDERVVIELFSDLELPMAGWQLEENDGQIFEFSQFVLFQGGAVNVYTNTGTDTVLDLHWGLGEPVWESGETAILRDPEGNIRASFTVP
jgi:LysM repeat protein